MALPLHEYLKEIKLSLYVYTPSIAWTVAKVSLLYYGVA